MATKNFLKILKNFPPEVCRLLTDGFHYYFDHFREFSPLNISPRVRSDVTPRVTRAGIASGLIQNDIHDITTISADGMYV